MKLVLLGAPGAGKGTQAQFITQEFSIPQISTGDMLRAAVKKESVLGTAAQKYMSEGKLVPDQIIIDLVKDRIQMDDCQAGFLLDGFPRTIPQAEELSRAQIYLDGVIEIQVPDSEIIKRLSGRRVEPESGRSYHVIFNPPKISGKDDVSGAPLIQREDDQEETVKKRLEIYNLETRKLIDFYSKTKPMEPSSPKYLKIPGVGDVGEIRNKISTEINILKNSM